MFDKNTWNYINACKLLVLDKNTWNYITGQIICINNSYLKLKLFTNYYTFWRVFHTSVSRWFLPEVWVTSKSLQISTTLLSILADLKIVWMVSSRPLISKFFSSIIIIIYPFRVFNMSVNWWFYTGVWVTASLLKSPGLVSGFWPSLAMLSFG